MKSFRTRGVASVILVAIATSMVAACGGASDPQSAPTIHTSQQQALACPEGPVCSVEEVAASGVRALFSYQSADSDPPAAAAERAGVMLTTRFRDTGEWDALAQIPSERWASWRDQNVAISAKPDLLPTSQSGNSSNSVIRRVGITQTVTPESARSIVPAGRTVLVTLVKGGPVGWQIDMVRNQ